MFSAMTLNYLIWENPSNLPIPSEVKELTDKINWGEFVWQTTGLPEDEATYSLLDGKILYKDKSPDGKIDVEKQEFTGAILFGSYLIGESTDKNYLLTFRAVFFKGELNGVQVESIVSEDKAFYNKMNLRSAAQDLINEQRNKSKIYNFIYKPYRAIIRATAWVILLPLVFLRWIIVKTIRILTPY